MRARLVLLCAALLWVGLVSPSRAFNAATAEILGLRLGMDEQQVNAVLSHQGVPPNRISRKTGACPDDKGCDTTLIVMTGDGALTINLTVPGTDREKPALVSEITYAFRGWGAEEPRAIADSVIEHFGRPTQTDPMMWCQRPATDLHCPAHQPILRFATDKLVLVLSSGFSTK